MPQAQSMPVDQTGENILFVIDGPTVEAHIQIQYTGDPEKFAWVVPVMSEPDVEVGSDPLFQALLNSTVPTFVTQTQFESCGGGGGGFGCGDSSFDSAAGGDGGRGDEGEDGGGTPEVLRSGVAGAFEFSVLDGGTVDGVIQWLEDNNYAQDDDAAPILEQYLNDGFMFVAFKLTAGTGVEEIHPVVLRYSGGEPCVPIRLTRIAAKDDMGIRTFFFSDSRVVPTNYRSVEINQLGIDWVNPGSNYESVVTAAVDSPGAEGHGFVTEYAGTSAVITPDTILDPQWDASRFAEADPFQAIAELKVQGLIDCETGPTCVVAMPIVEGIVDQFLPAPLGVERDDFYSDPSRYEEDFDLEAWNAAEFVATLEERLIGPAEHAVDVLAAHAYLTRLYTTISPHEMTVDPLFHQNPTLAEVSNVYNATIWRTCEGPDYVLLADGRRIALDDVGQQPLPGMFAERVSEIPGEGPAMVLVDNRDAIDEEVAAWNDQQGLDDSDEGCNCRSTRFNVHGPLMFAVIFGFGWLSRRRRRA